MTDQENITNEETENKNDTIEEKKDQLKQAKEFMFSLIQHTIKQTENNKTRLRLVEWQLSWDWFIIKQVQYKNGKNDFVLSEYKEWNEYVLSTVRNLEKFYDLFVTKVF